ncbi:SRPBCC domain-containing protein [Haoranjiania flava]|uniref:SRPBCC domain-containing protein n=1 Tax=Haoranjiania flava TaxID=1856322 RepID=A0AAE3INF2_9BACT|nr:SRPBCC domain-containing protein [Haoranjiania flava]MCU7694295.1 SRPBCC domain-containing protein [Haoranjiania flava]
MIKLSFEKKINAPAQKVWDALWSKDTYTIWTKYFSPGSSMQSDWKVNGRTYFTDASKKNGIVSTIIKMNKPTEIVFEHIGILKDGEEDVSSDEAKSFAGALESYHLAEDGITTLTGSVETAEEYEEMMRSGFEKGFEEVRKLAEA